MSNEQVYKIKRVGKYKVVCRQDLDTLQELVDKTIPMKPIGYNYEHDYTYFSYVRYYCPSCENKVEVKNKYCPHCGQALDWSKLW